MLSGGVLVYPDTGPAFLRTVKINALLCERVHTLSRIIRPESPGMFAAAPSEASSEGGRRVLDRFETYRKFADASGPELRLLQSEGVLIDVTRGRGGAVSLAADSIRSFFRSPEAEELMRRASKRRSLATAVHECPVGFPEVMMVALLTIVHDRVDQEFLEDVRADPVSFLDLGRAIYFALLPSLATALNVPLCTWSPTFEQGALAFPGTSRPDTSRRESAVASRVFDTNLPDISRLHAEDLLELRRTCLAEIHAFRVGVAEMAADVDPEEPVENQRAAVDALVAKKVNPAILDLRRSIQGVSLASATKALNSWKSVGTGAVAAAASFAVGAPPDLALASSAVAVLAKILAEGAVERAAIRSASRWSLVLKLDKKMRKRGVPRG